MVFLQLALPQHCGKSSLAGIHISKLTNRLAYVCPQDCVNGGILISLATASLVFHKTCLKTNSFIFNNLKHTAGIAITVYLTNYINISYIFPWAEQLVSCIVPSYNIFHSRTICTRKNDPKDQHLHWKKCSGKIKMDHVFHSRTIFSRNIGLGDQNFHCKKWSGTIFSGTKIPVTEHL